jgi:galactokinase
VHQYVQSIVHIAADAVAAIERGDAQALAAQMTLAQTAFDACCMPNCPSQLTSPRLHALMNDQVLRACSLAVKGVGSQGDGSAQILCSSASQQEQVRPC